MLKNKFLIIASGFLLSLSSLTVHADTVLSVTADTYNAFTARNLIGDVGIVMVSDPSKVIWDDSNRFFGNAAVTARMLNSNVISSVLATSANGGYSQIFNATVINNSAVALNAVSTILYLHSPEQNIGNVPFAVLNRSTTEGVSSIIVTSEQASLATASAAQNRAVTITRGSMYIFDGTSIYTMDNMIKKMSM